jgi:hypothetical protein
VFSGAINKEKEMKAFKLKTKSYVFVDDMSIYIESSKKSLIKLLELIKLQQYCML